MILSDKTLRELIASGDLGISPLEKDSIQPASIDCRLGDHFKIFDKEKYVDRSIDLESEADYKSLTQKKITIQPHSFLLATTQEYIKLPSNITSFVEGRSSIGRIGLFIQNAGWVDPGFEGQITLELYNANAIPICIEAGRRICQLVFCKVDQKVLNPYCGKYQGQKNTTGSLIYKDREVGL